MSAHLLIVGYYTYPVHRERLITGSGSLINPYELLSEQSILEICCDFSRVAIGDHIYFYVVKDSELRIKVPILRELYRYLYGTECHYSRKAETIRSIRNGLETIDNPEKTVSDFFENNEDYIDNAYRYLLEVMGKPESELDSGFHGIFEVIEEPYLMEYGEDFKPEKNVYGIEPYNNNVVNNYLWMRIKVKPLKIFPNPISEFEYLDDFTDDIMSWTVLYRKLFGKRSCTALPPIEENKLIRILERVNTEYRDSNEYNELSINITKEYSIGDRKYRFKPDWNNDIRGGGVKVSEFVKNKIESSEITLNSESILEAASLFELAYQNKCVFLDGPSKKILMNSACDEGERIAWVGNQVICSAGGSQSDIVSFQVLDGESDIENTHSINVIELKNRELEAQDIEQAGKYARWLASTYLRGKTEKVRNIITGFSESGSIHSSVIEVAKKRINEGVRIRLITYKLDNGIIKLKHHDIKS